MTSKGRVVKWEWGLERGRMTVIIIQYMDVRNYLRINLITKNSMAGISKMAQWIRSLTAPTGGPVLVPSIHITAHNYL